MVFATFLCLFLVFYYWLSMCYEVQIKSLLITKKILIMEQELLQKLINSTMSGLQDPAMSKCWTTSRVKWVYALIEGFTCFWTIGKCEVVAFGNPMLFFAALCLWEWAPKRQNTQGLGNRIPLLMKMKNIGYKK